jgi:surfeit locus 1 family protein
MKTPSFRSLSVTDVVPPLAALALVVLFTALGFWQLERAEQKRALEDAFAAPGAAREVVPGIAPARFERLRATGRFVAHRQFLIDNIVQDGRLGTYVITPMELESGGPLLLVNRGWMPRVSGQVSGQRSDQGPGARSIEVDAAPRTVTGRAGGLPRVALRPGEAFTGDEWPRHATFPTTEELAAALGRDVLPFVLLADPDPASGLVRHWQPAEMGPARHLGYAVQWFAMALAVVAVTIVVYRRRRTAG